MNRMWTGVVAGVLAAALLLTVGVGAYQAGRDDRVVTRTMDGEVVRYVDGHGGPFFPGFFLVPLLVIGGIVLLVRGGRRWQRPYGPGGHGPGYGPGYWGGPGFGPGRGGPCGGGLEDWHRRQHEGDAGGGTAPGTGEPADAAVPGASGAPGDPGPGGAGAEPADRPPQP